MHTAVIGAQWGDEGKGKIVDFLAQNADVVVRYQGGANAGHTVVVGEEKFALHLLPSGILHPTKISVIGDGVIVHPATLIEELSVIKKRVKKTSKIYLSNKVNLVMPWHIVRDGIAGGAIGTTKRGIGPTYSDATARRGIRVMDLEKPVRLARRVAEEVEWNKGLIALMLKHHVVGAKDKKALGIADAVDSQKVTKEYLSQLKTLQKLGVEIVDGSKELQALDSKKKQILFEGAQATLLDITHGDYPFVTSSHPTIGGLYIGSGFRPRNIMVVGVAKAYVTRVGNGPFVSELFDRIGDGIRERGHEYGTTTGRPRRCGWFDAVSVRYSARVNGLDCLAITKLDILSGLKELKVALAYAYKNKQLVDYPADVEVAAHCKPVYKTLPGWEEDISKVAKFADLPKAAQNYIRFLSKTVGVPVRFVGVGPARKSLLTLK